MAAEHTTEIVNRSSTKDIQRSFPNIVSDVPIFAPLIPITGLPDYTKNYIRDFVLKSPAVEATEKRETILEWWKGKVVEIVESDHENFFIAHLVDLNNGQSTAEFNFDAETKAQGKLFEGAEFAFFIVKKHGFGNPRMESRLEFNTPHIWRKEDEEATKHLFSQLFPNDDPL